MKPWKLVLILLLPLLAIGVFLVKGKKGPVEPSIANMEEIFNRKERFDSSKFIASPDYYKELVRILREARRPYARARAATLLVYISTPSPAKPLFDALNFDQNRDVRLEALRSLQGIRGLNRRARAVVNIEGINSKDPSVITASLKSLYAQTRAPGANRHLYEVITEAFPDSRSMKILKSTATVVNLSSVVNASNDREVRLAALDVLGYAKAPPMIRISLPLVTNRNESIRKQVAKTLGLMRHYDAVVPLTNMLNTDKSQSVRLAAAESLATLHAYAPLQAALISQKDAMARMAAVTALGSARNPLYFNSIKDALKDSNSEVRKAAAYALGRYRTTAAQAPLQAALKAEKAPAVKAEMTQALRLSGAN